MQLGSRASMKYYAPNAWHNYLMKSQVYCINNTNFLPHFRFICLILALNEADKFILGQIIEKIFVILLPTTYKLNKRYRHASVRL